MINKTKIYLSKNYFILIIFILAIFLRVFHFGTIPGGLTTDEAMTGYNAWTLANFQTDMWGHHYPFYLKAWGSGMNALYEYLMLPILKIWTLNIYSERAVSLITSLILLPIFYLFLKKIWNQKVATTGLLLLAINPWAIMIARQGLESNILPCILLIAFTCFVYQHYYWAAAFFALSIYAYSSVLLALPLILGVLYLWSLYQQQMTWFQAFKSAGIFLLIALPMILWFAVNSFNMSAFDLGFFSVERFTMIRKTLGGNPAQNWLLLGTQFDGLWQNATPISAITYIVNLFFAFIGLLMAVKMRQWVLGAWGSGIIALTFSVQGNINRYNLAWLAILALTALGLSKTWQWLSQHSNWLFQWLKILIIVILTLPNLLFLKQYFTTFNNTPAIQKVYNQGFEAALHKAKQQHGPINIIQPGNQRYSLVLFYDRPTPKEFISTVKFAPEKHEFLHITQFTNYTFTKQPIINQQTTVITPNYAHLKLSNEHYTSNKFGIYTVYQPK
ncbi:glycosyltransferase family 39 protein [Weissella coleopterorum]|uniref:Glycosyltransferase family 39 protein n=2 Tax=Weissella coleopterorum TaxID=2714949 RepID=A0A6G8AYU2_9LACO|nr:glycosyltransferase family 39 protein [Weissella coleopterorum]